jgi:hypothetical protein
MATPGPVYNVIVAKGGIIVVLIVSTAIIVIAEGFDSDI